MKFSPKYLLPGVGTAFLFRDLGRDLQSKSSGSGRYSRTAPDLSPFAGTDRESEAQAIVDKYKNMTFSPNFLQSVAMHVLGDYSSLDNFYMNVDQNMNGELQALQDSLVTQQHNEAYQDPSADVQRQRSAGLNPDLQGLSGQEGQAVPTPADETPVDFTSMPGSEESMVSLVSGIGSVASVVATGLDIAGMVRDFGHQNRMNALKEIGALAGSQPGLFDLLAGIGGESSPSVDMSPGSSVSEFGSDMGSIAPAVSVAQGKDIIGSLPISKRAQAVLRKLASTPGFKRSLESQRAGMLSDMQRSVGIMASPGFSSDLQQWSTSYNEKFSDLLDSLEHHQLTALRNIARYDAKMHGDAITNADFSARMMSDEASISYDEYRSEFYNKLDPNVLAGLENDNARTQFVSNEVSRMNDGIEKATEQFWSEQLEKAKQIQDPDARAVAVNGVLINRNKWRTTMMEYRARKLTQAGKTLGETDYLDAFKTGLGVGNGLMPSD